MDYDSDFFLSSKTKHKWLKIGTVRRSGVALPLFSIYTQKSVGIGEIPDLRKVIDWCNLTGMSIIQLLPINELGSDFAPYNALSTFALEPMYLSISKLRKVDMHPFRKELRKMKKEFPAGLNKVNYKIKAAKLSLLRKIFDSVNLSELKSFQEFIEKNNNWLRYYCLYKILLRMNSNEHWEKWDFRYKYISSLNTEKILSENKTEYDFYSWLQWQLYEQLITIKRYAKQKKVLIMGDLPFLVSRNSADVWSYKNYFKLNLSAGAPPDMYLAKGQRWGMPPYNWDNIAADNFSYIKERLRYAENFYDMFRIDHFIGLFRIWTIDLKIPEEYGGMFGRFDPEEEYLWEENGRRILNEMNDSTSMLPCAEDLGTVPEASHKVLKEFGIPGINVQRWEKKWNDGFVFIEPEEYRINSAATVSTHDSSLLPDWWENEAGTVDVFAFEDACKKINLTGEYYQKLLNQIFEKPDSVKRLRWKQEINNIYEFIEILNQHIQNSIHSTHSIHSTQAASELANMYLSTYDEKIKFSNYIGIKNIKKKTDVNFVKKCFDKVSSTNSIFNIQLIQEYLFLDPGILSESGKQNNRINLPGTVSENNWTAVIPVSLEELMTLKINSSIKEMNLRYGRI